MKKMPPKQSRINHLKNKDLYLTCLKPSRFIMNEIFNYQSLTKWVLNRVGITETVVYVLRRLVCEAT